MGLWKFFKETVAAYRCKHFRVRIVYGDEINFRNGYRWACVDCGGTVKKFNSNQDYKVVR